MVSDQMTGKLAVEIDLSNLGSGIYVLWIYHGDEKTVSRRTLIVHGDGGLALLV